jgi:hypothetical protein
MAPAVHRHGIDARLTYKRIQLPFRHFDGNVPYFQLAR